MKNLLLTLFFMMALKASAQKPTILLDFDGHYVTGTSWNTGGTPIDAKPSGLDEAKMVEVANRISEDYSIFDVVVTRDEAVFNAAPEKLRMRLILTISWEWYGKAGGIAFKGSFTWGDDTPCFVFTSLHNYNIKHIAEAGSHEVGHTLGLRHQATWNDACVKTEDYASGVGSGEIGWAPIMGVGYYRNQTTWTKGKNVFGDCGTEQDDLGIITQLIKLKADDHDDINGTKIVAKKVYDGIITDSLDVDAFDFDVATVGTYTFTAAPYSVAAGNSGANLKIRLGLYNNKNELIQEVSPETILNASITTSLTPGTYKIKVSGASSAYSAAYNSVGRYTLRMDTANALPVKMNAPKVRVISKNVIEIKLEVYDEVDVSHYEIQLFINGEWVTKKLEYASADKERKIYTWTLNLN